LLVVIAIIAILAALLLPSLKRVRDSAKSMQCANNLRQISVVARLYSNEYGDSFPLSQTGVYIFSDCLRIFMGQTNKNTTAESSIFVCPSDRNGTLYKPSGYWLSYGQNAYLNGNPASPSQHAFADIQYPSEVCLFSDMEGHYVVNTGTIDMDKAVLLSARHNGSINVAYVDGHVGKVDVFWAESSSVSDRFWANKVYFK
jgi:general secretion pathway protein G